MGVYEEMLLKGQRGNLLSLSLSFLFFCELLMILPDNSLRRIFSCMNSNMKNTLVMKLFMLLDYLKTRNNGLRLRRQTIILILALTTCGVLEMSLNHFGCQCCNLYNKMVREFPDGPVVGTPPFHGRGTGLKVTCICITITLLYT